MVRKNEYPRKTDFLKEGVKVNETVSSNASQKGGEFHHKESSTRNSRPPRENQQRDSNQQKEYQHRENPKRENTTRDNQLKDNVQRENTSRENTSRDNHQKNYHRENIQNRDGFRDNREPYRQHNQRPAIKPQTEENVEDISADIVRIEKEIELELKEIKSMRLGI
ncbi:MAG: hypothetical protein ACYDG2_06020 [Ruminiclostridium sp.]